MHLKQDRKMLPITWPLFDVKSKLKHNLHLQHIGLKKNWNMVTHEGKNLGTSKFPVLRSSH